MSEFVDGLALVLALIGAGVVIMAARFGLEGVGDGIRHRWKVRRLVRSGEPEPKLSSEWRATSDGPLFGVTGIEGTCPVAVTEYAKHAKRIQRKVEEAWIEGVERYPADRTDPTATAAGDKGER